MSNYRHESVNSSASIHNIFWKSKRFRASAHPGLTPKPIPNKSPPAMDRPCDSRNLRAHTQSLRDKGHA